jgi:hypothetical protein
MKDLSNGKTPVEVVSPLRVKSLEATGIRDAGSKAPFGQPTAAEVSRLTFAKLRDIRVHTQELRNRFARLLNRGSSLE